ncbi:hypothetical protein [Anaerobacillus sp. CMMVII]|uniref:hypothetical protein n=1 Tax=Anaerobacillus sp. CMMVII TaxID=2755588 RepID=UPI0021B8492F|nr:hypothetical protein [Anaerobacillus sp. CMMVII]
MKKVLGILILLYGLTACTTNPDFKLYEGGPLNIAVIGDAPEVKEDQVVFEEIDFEDLFDNNLKAYDAVFIMEAKLLEASQGKYADIYLNSNLPFFFIGATTSYRPFLEQEVTYDKDLDLKDVSNHYAIGVEEETYWYFGYIMMWLAKKI